LEKIVYFRGSSRVEKSAEIAPRAPGVVSTGPYRVKRVGDDRNPK